VGLRAHLATVCSFAERFGSICAVRIGVFGDRFPVGAGFVQKVEKMSKKQYSIEQIVKSLEHLKKQRALAVTVKVDEMNRLIFGYYDSGLQRETTVTVFSNDVTKTPEVNETKNLE